MTDFLNRIKQERLDTAKSILDFDFKKKRVRILSKCENVKENSKGVLYWMSREFRVQDNWNMLFAQKLALKNQVPLHVIFFLLPKFLNATTRHYKFLIRGLKQVKEECEELDITFHLYPGWPYENLPKIVADNDLGAVVCDFFPLRLPMKWQEDVKNKLPDDIAFVQVSKFHCCKIQEIISFLFRWMVIILFLVGLHRINRNMRRGRFEIK